MNTPQDKLNALLTEQAELEAWLAQVPAKEERLKQLRDDWGSQGKITQARLAIRDAAFPIFDPKGGWSKPIRIIAVDSKWVSIREDSRNEITRYRIFDGAKERTRGGWGKIDIQKALTIWKEHTAPLARAQ